MWNLAHGKKVQIKRDKIHKKTNIKTNVNDRLRPIDLTFDSFLSKEVIAAPTASKAEEMIVSFHVYYNRRWWLSFA